MANVHPPTHMQWHGTTTNIYHMCSYLNSFTCIHQADFKQTISVDRTNVYVWCMRTQFYNLDLNELCALKRIEKRRYKRK